MPQMSPINWLSLFFLFSMILMMFNIMNYYSYKMNNKSMHILMKIMHSNSNYMIWKW